MDKVEIQVKPLKETIKTGHLMGKYSSGKPGPFLFVMAGIHGNEPSGVIALHRVFEELKKQKAILRGTFMGVIGNLAALEKGERFIDEDMNRVWTEERMKRIASGNPKSVEESQARKVLDLINTINRENHYSCYFMDCHTTSSESQPYIAIHYHPRTYRFVHHFPVYIVKEEETKIVGTFDTYFNARDCTGFCFEAGQHDDLSSVENQEAMIWLMLAHSGCLQPKEVGCFPHCHEILGKTIVEGKKTFKLIHQYVIGHGEEFQMKPGFVNFQKIQKGEMLAHNQHGEILSRWDGRIFMPLYQKQGNDGFFVVREINKEEEPFHSLHLDEILAYER